MSATATPQHMTALALANQIRLEGLRTRAAMGKLPPDESRRRAAALLRKPPEAISHLRVGHFLSGIKRFGQTQAIRYIKKAGMNGSVWDRRVGPVTNDADTRQLTAPQREALAAALEEGL